jgi:hypothetical protein
MYDLGRGLLKWGVVCLVIAGAFKLVDYVFNA